MVDKKLLKTGIRHLLWALPLLFVGPSIIHMSFKNKGHMFFIPVLGFGIILCTLAVVLVFKGVRTMVLSLSDEVKQS